MPTLYVQEQGTMVRKRDNQVLVTKEGKTLSEAPLAKIDQVVLMGRGVQLSTALLIDLLERGIPVTITNQHGSRHYATLTAGPSRFGDLRISQMQFVNTPARALALAKEIVRAKLTNQRRLLAATGWAAAATAAMQIDAALTAAASAAHVDILRGHEGAAAAAYFGAWRASLPPAWGFGGRAFYPPPDPINAMLSFGYTLALHDVITAVQITGLDPYLGTFHVIEAGRPSLALDLLEEFRPLIVDRLVLDLIRTNALGREHFNRPPERPDAVYLNDTGRALLVQRYEAALHAKMRLPTGEQTPLRRIILLQVQTVARVLRGEQEQYAGYTPN
ncbi:CRISPR-associated endonuclease Cas1 [Roseiflexus sp.]|uniref:CRISPR-associated endonuclease Cas1 n=1 Tax=Roseiflexus sp. TaxID=2562120 RepID=UPI00398B386B